jgi:hypothetical protein
LQQSFDKLSLLELPESPAYRCRRKHRFLALWTSFQLLIMRLIDVLTGDIVDFIGQGVPKYAILSHTWGAEEVLYLRPGEAWPVSKQGYHKIMKACQLTQQRHLRYLWVDTCCIDKSSSAELPEAINSMYRWYQNAEVCLVHLVDLPEKGPLDSLLPDCRWFKRG